MNKIILVGFEEATITRDFYNLISQIQPVEILHPDKLLLGQYPTGEFLVSVTRDKQLRQSLIDYLDNHALPRATFVHSSAVVDSQIAIGGGTFIGPFASAFNNAEIGKDCIVGPYSMISHKSKLGQGSILHPGTMIAGSTKIGKYCLFGLRSTVIDKIEICDDVVVGAASFVTKPISVPGTYVGTPARKVA
jgi:UDP-3-O-[3-hydroxymyristoyl] glucosamine N-acyltransferase